MVENDGQLSLKLECCNPWPHVANRHKPAIVIVTSFSLWRHSALAAPVLIMTSF